MGDLRWRGRPYGRLAADVVRMPDTSTSTRARSVTAWARHRAAPAGRLSRYRIRTATALAGSITSIPTTAGYAAMKLELDRSSAVRCWKAAGRSPRTGAAEASRCMSPRPTLTLRVLQTLPSAGADRNGGQRRFFAPAIGDQMHANIKDSS